MNTLFVFAVPGVKVQTQNFPTHRFRSLDDAHDYMLMRALLVSVQLELLVLCAGSA